MEAMDNVLNLMCIYIVNYIKVIKVVNNQVMPYE
jgi:hypothetical protein